MLYIWMFSNKIDLNQALRVSHIIFILDLFENDWVPGNWILTLWEEWEIMMVRGCMILSRNAGSQNDNEAPLSINNIEMIHHLIILLTRLFLFDYL